MIEMRGKNTGRSLHPLYNMWRKMIDRCHCENSKDFERYGARGIKVCARWRQSVFAFAEDMGQKPSPLHSIERIDNEGDYEPGNCRWATDAEQRRNKRTNHFIEIDGKRKTIEDWATEKGVHPRMIIERLTVLKWSERDAVMQPASRIALIRRSGVA